MVTAFVVEIDPGGAGLGGHRGDRLEPTDAALRHERRPQGDPPHPPGPDHQGVGAVRGPLVAVTGTLDDQTHAPFPREVDRRGDVGGAPGRHGEGARGRGPGVEPAGDLGPARLIADPEGVEVVARRLRSAGGALAIAGAALEQGPDRDQIAARRRLQLAPGRRVRPRGIAGAHPGRSPCGRRQAGWKRGGQWRRRRGLQQAPAIHRASPSV